MLAGPLNPCGTEQGQDIIYIYQPRRELLVRFPCKLLGFLSVCAS